MQVTADGRRLLRLEVRNAATPIERKPPWIKTRLRTGPEYVTLHELVAAEGLHTVCQEAGCPNIYECREDREATFLIRRERCIWGCDFCQIDTGKQIEIDRDEPRRVAESVATMGLHYATITGVARDDLDDGGAWLYAETVRQIHAILSGCGVELLIRTSTVGHDYSRRFSIAVQRCWPTTWKRSLGFFGGFGPASAMNGRST